MPTKDLRFPFDEKGMKTLPPALLGKRLSYWEENRLLHGRVKAAEMLRDRYGNPFIRVELEEEAVSA